MAFHEVLLKIQSLFRRRSMASEIREELEFHQALLRDRLSLQGIPPAELDIATRRTFGNAVRWRERLTELWQFATLENLVRDLNFSARLLRKSPGFTAVALLTLTLGVGANTAVFSLINGLLLRPLPVPHAEQLAVLRMEEGGPQPNYSFCTPFFRSLERNHDVFSDVFAYNPDTLQVRGRSANENIPGMLVSGQFFRALQTPPLMGRYLTPEDDRPGGNPEGLAVVITEQFWETWFDRAPDVVGRKLIIANVPFNVVGVMPKRFIGADPTRKPQIFAPLSTDPIIDAPRNHIDDGIHAWWLTVGARLRPGATLEQANASLATVSRPILHAASDDAEFIGEEEKGHFHFVAEPGSRGFAYARLLFRRPLLAMFAMCGGILLLACLNLAGLMMARGAARERELATRLAIGATRRRLIQQLLVESLLIAILGTAAGLAVAPLVSRSLAALLLSADSGWRLDTSLDVRVLCFAACVAVISAVLIGLVPALEATSVGISGKAAKFTDNSAIYADNDFPVFGQALTVELWVNPGSEPPASGQQSLIVHEQDFALRLEPGGRLGCYVNVNSTWQSTVGPVGVPARSWTHLAMTYDGKNLACYTDGVSRRVYVTGQLGYSGTPMLIGGMEPGESASSPYIGLIDEVRVFSRVRSPDQIVGDMLSPLRHGPPRGNVLDLRFSDSDRFLTDDSGFANNAHASQSAHRWPRWLCDLICVCRHQPSQVPELAPGVEGNAVAFHGASKEYVRVPDRLSLQSQGDLLTAETWVKTSTTKEALLIGKWDGVNPGWRLAINNASGQVRFEVISATPTRPTPIHTSFVSLQPVNDSHWHHVAGVYDEQKLMVYVDGLPALRTCTSPDGSDANTCVRPPPDACSTVQFDNPIAPHGYGNAVCATGSIINNLDIYIGNYEPTFFHGFRSLLGMLDEVRLSNYAKREDEMAGSAGLYSSYTQILGQQAEMTNKAERENSSYDLLGREATTHKFIDAGAYVTRSAVDNLGRTASFKFPDGEVTVSRYDRAGTQNGLIGYGNFVGDGGIFGRQTYLFDAGVDVVSRLKNEFFGNRVGTGFTYNDQATQSGPVGTFGDELLSGIFTQSPDSSTLQSQQYMYDAAGNLRSRTDQATRLHDAPLSSSYTYDDLDRLSGFQTSFRNSSASFTGSYVYDSLGNMTRKDGLTLGYGLLTNASNCGRILVTSVPHAVTSVVSGTQTKQYCYDQNGRLMQIRLGSGPAAQTFTHNVMGKLSHIKQQTSGPTLDFSFSYDGNGTRVKKIEPTGTTIEPFGFYRLTPQGSERFYFTNGRRSVRRLGAGSSNVFWYHPEHLGGTNLMTGPDGHELQDAYSEYYPYGGVLPTAANNNSGSYSGQNTPDTTKKRSGGFQFTGKELDDSAFYYFNARYFDPGIGRFIEPDALAPRSDPQGLNLYSYVANNPLKFIDPTGQQEESPDDPTGKKTKYETIVHAHRDTQPESKTVSTVRDYGDFLDLSPHAQRELLIGNGIRVGSVAMSPATPLPFRFDIDEKTSWFSGLKPFANEELDFLDRLERGFEKMGQMCPPGVQCMVIPIVPAFGAEEAAAALRPFNEGGGHHIPAKSAFIGDPVYNPDTALAIPNSELAAQGVSHSAITGAQQTLYRAFAKTGEPLTWDAVQSIETRALIKGGMNPGASQATVTEAINALKASGVSGPTRIPWGEN